MRHESTLESVLKRDRWIVGSGLIGITLLSWGYLIHEARAMDLTGVCECFGLKMTSPDLQRWGWIEIAALFLMWTEMMVAMMVPTVAPAVAAFALLNRKRYEQHRPYVPSGLFLSGYLATWTLFSLLAAAAQGSLHTAALLSPGMVSTSPVFGGLLLVAAGLYQWTSLKQVCLRHCQSPLELFMTSWREGNWGAFRMGFAHGAYCTACCWCLMAILFVAGVMNIAWVAAITVLVLLEKMLPKGAWLGRAAGAVLVVWGVWMMASAAN